MTTRIYCEDCNDYGYLFVDGEQIEVISSCKCPNLFLIGEAN
jgi:hypothetical protein